jgi:hypothetical protein
MKLIHEDRDERTIVRSSAPLSVCHTAYTLTNFIEGI